MQTLQNRFAGLDKIAFGSTASTRQTVASGASAVPVLFGLAFQLTNDVVFLHFLVWSGLIASGTLLALKGRDQLVLDFSKSLYYRESGAWPASRVTGGHLSDITHVAITRVLASESIAYSVSLVFRPEANQPPCRIDHLPCSLVKGTFGDLFPFYLELATRLNVPVHDDSGWNGSRP